MATQKTFEDYGPSTADRRLCPRCQRVEKEGSVQVRLNKMKPDSSSRFDQVASRQVSLCEGCSIEVYETLVNSLNSESNGGTRRPRNADKVTHPTTRTATPATRRRSRRTRA